MGKDKQINTPVAIIVAGLLVMAGIIITGGFKCNCQEIEPKTLSEEIGVTKDDLEIEPKTLSEEIGVTKDDLTKCIEGKDLEALGEKIEASVSGAMVNVPENQRGTPYSIIVGANGFKTEIRGARQPEQIKELIAEVNSGEVTDPYEGDLVVSEEGDRINGNPDAPIKIITYSDLECPYCAMLNEYLKQIVLESDGQVATVFRHWPIHQNSFTKLVAAECVGDLLGNEAYFQYIDLIFGLMTEEEEDSIEDIL